MIQEAINHAKKVAEYKYEEGLLCNAKSKNDTSNICIKCAKMYENIAEWLEELQQYRAIGTVEECREARERQRAKDIIHNPDGGVDEDWLCPSCVRFCSPYAKHCQHCGQSVKVGESPWHTK